MKTRIKKKRQAEKELIQKLLIRNFQLHEELNTLKEELKQYEKQKIKPVDLPPELNELLTKGMEEFNFSSRIMNIFQDNNIRNLRDLVKLTKRKFSLFRNTGKKTIQEIDEFLSSKGLKWNMDV